jgi:tetratricopeptide (TPR) repeat protein
MTSRRVSNWIPILVLILAGSAAYLNSLNCPFVFDDQYTIVRNPFIRTLWPLSSAMSSPYQSSVAGRPVAAFSLALSYAVNGLDPRVFHITNVLIHLAAGLLLFGVVRRTLLLPGMIDRWGGAATGLATAISLIWIVHPLQTESVTYVIQRSESIAGLFYLATLYCFIRSTQSLLPISWGLGAIIACGLGMASKEIVITAPFLILVYDRIFVAGSWREVRRRWPLHAGLASTWIILFLLIRGGPRSDTAGFSMHGLSAMTYAATEFGVILHYLALAVFPKTLNIDYAWQYVSDPLDWVPQMLVILVLLGATIYALRRAPRAGFLAAAFFILLSPTSSFVPISDAAFEHRMYLPLAPLCVLAVMEAHWVVRRLTEMRPESGSIARAAALCLLAAACLGLSARTVVRNRDYSSAVNLWKTVLQTNPRNPRAFVSLGNHLLEEKNYQEAESMYRHAIELDPEYPASYYGLAMTQMQQGRSDEALNSAQQAVRIDTIYPEAKLLMGTILTKLNRLDEAEAAFMECLAINPDHAEANFNLACIYDKKGRDKEAEAHYLRAIQVQPAYAEACRQLADLYMHMNQPQQAVEWYMKHLTLADATPRELNRLATALSQLNRLEESISYYQEALRLDPKQPAVRFNFGNTLMRLGRKNDAIMQYEEALRINPNMEPARQALSRARGVPSSQP